MIRCQGAHASALSRNIKAHVDRQVNDIVVRERAAGEDGRVSPTSVAELGITMPPPPYGQSKSHYQKKLEKALEKKRKQEVPPETITPKTSKIKKNRKTPF